MNLYSNSTGNHNSRSKSKKQLNKSASSADHLDKTGGFETSVAPPVALGRRGFSLERPLENIEKKKSASESNLLAAATSSNDIAPTTADTGHSVAFIQKFVSNFLLFFVKINSRYFEGFFMLALSNLVSIISKEK